MPHSPPKIENTAALAKHLGLSRWTVSRAINGHPDVNPETASKVLAAIEELGFAPNAFARNLRAKGSRTIGICLQEMETPILVRKVAALQQMLTREKGYYSVLELSDHRSLNAETIQRFVSLRVEGIILAGTHSPDHTGGAIGRMLRGHRIPVVCLEPRQPCSHNAVLLDRRSALAQLTDLLIDRGHRSFGLLGIDRSFLLGIPRVDGVEQALRARGMDPQSCLQTIVIPGRETGSFNYGQELGERLLRLPELPTGLLALNDEIASGVIWSLQRAGLKLSQDVSITGFDNAKISAHLEPALTTVDHQIENLVDAAIETLFSLIEDPQAQLPARMIAPSVIVRDSIGAAYLRPGAVPA